MTSLNKLYEHEERIGVYLETLHDEIKNLAILLVGDVMPTKVIDRKDPIDKQAFTQSMMFRQIKSANQISACVDEVRFLRAKLEDDDRKDRATDSVEEKEMKEDMEKSFRDETEVPSDGRI